MFEVYNKRVKQTYDKNNRKIITVYGIRYKNGYPYFTIYEDGQWITRSAKWFMPVIIEEEKEDNNIK